MAKLHKTSLFSMLGASLLLLTASCHETTQDKPNPNYPPPAIKVTGPAGFRQGDSAEFDAIMRGDAVPDTNRLKKPAAPHRF